MSSPEVFEELLARMACDGPRRHARWDQDSFDAIARGPALALWRAIAGEEEDAQVLAGYLELVQEAVGAGYFRGVDPAQSFLARGLLDLVPGRLAGIAPRRRLDVLAKLWNLGEGLLSEPPWVDRYVSACSATFADLEQIEASLVQALELVLTPTRAARWTGTFDVSVLDTRPIDDSFLPGRMHLAAPSVVCVHDAQRSAQHLALLLQPMSKSRFLGIMPCLGEYPEPRGLPAVSFKQSLTVGDRVAELPFVRASQQQVVAESGFIVVSAVDSQRLWIVESP